MAETFDDKGDLLEKNIPLPASTIVESIGDIGRQLRLSLRYKSDFPLSVTVVTTDGREISATLKDVYTDGTSQADGTFYFTEPVRFDDQPNKTFLWGNEIKSITIHEA